MENLLIKIYNTFPSGIRKGIGNSAILKPFRNSLLRSNGVYNEAEVSVKRDYLGYKMEFIFFASIKVAAKAKKSGIENTILRNSIQLIKNLKATENDATILDIGASFGYLSLVWANSIAQNGRVISFEPNPNVFKSFRKSISSNNLDSIIHLNNLAVGAKDEKIELFLNSTSSNTLNIKGKKRDGITIDMVSVDSFTKKNNIVNCDLVKIDVDGIELDILLGSQELLKKCKPIFIVETNGDEKIIEFFNQNSYEILDMQLNVFQPGNKLPLNIFCIPKTR